MKLLNPNESLRKVHDKAIIHSAKVKTYDEEAQPAVMAHFCFIYIIKIWKIVWHLWRTFRQVDTQIYRFGVFTNQI